MLHQLTCKSAFALCSYQSGFLSILYSIGSKPLEIWDKEGEHDDSAAMCAGFSTVCIQSGMALALTSSMVQAALRLRMKLRTS
jgi:hypothetical protein